MLYLCSLGLSGKSPFVVVLGFFSGQKEDFITKDLIEPVADGVRRSAQDAVAGSLSSEYSAAHIFFL